MRIPVLIFSVVSQVSPGFGTVDNTAPDEMEPYEYEGLITYVPVAAEVSIRELPVYPYENLNFSIFIRLLWKKFSLCIFQDVPTDQKLDHLAYLPKEEFPSRRKFAAK